MHIRVQNKTICFQNKKLGQNYMACDGAQYISQNQTLTLTHYIFDY